MFVKYMKEIGEVQGIPKNSYALTRRLDFIYSTIKKKILEDKEYNLLDVGCGTGELLTIPLGTLLKNINLLGIDTDHKSIGYANNINPSSNIKFEAKSINMLNKNLKFDFIICSEVLEHLDKPNLLLNQIKEHLKDDGIIIVTIPNGYGPFEIENRIHKIILQSRIRIFFRKMIRNEGKNVPENSKKDSLCEDPHVQFFTYKKFKKMCSKLNLSILNSSNRIFLVGAFSSLIIDRNNFILDLNEYISDYIPHFLASGWMFVIQKGI